MHAISHSETMTSAVSNSAPHDSEAPLKFETLRAGELDDSLLGEWQKLRQQDAVYTSPYFDPEFTKAIAKVRDDVRVAVASRNGEIVSILPYQINSPKNAVPAGGMLNDWHGPIGSSDPAVVKGMLSESGLSSYKYHCIARGESKLLDFSFREVESHYLDLSDGWEAYRKWVRKHSSTVKRQGQKTRALEREVGPVRFEFDCREESLLEKLIEMKRSRYQRSDTFDILSVDWARQLLREIFSTRKPNFSGLLSAYWAGDQLVGVHFGMLTKDILHYWFPVYDPQFQRYSPGTEMLLQSAQHACERGATKLDLGYGDDTYKFKFCNAHAPVHVGLVNFNSLSWQVSKRQYELRMSLKQMPMKPIAKKLLRNVFPGFGGWNFR